MLHLLVDNNNGVVFVMTLIIVSLLAILGATFANLVTFEMRNATWQRQRVQGFYIAEAGIAMGYSVLKDSINGLDNLDSILVGADGIPNTDDDGILNFGPSVPLGEGSYSVVVTDNDDGDGDYFSDSDDIVEIVSTGTIVKMKRTINVLFAALPFVINHAIVAGGDFKISGNPTIQGSHGGAYINGNLTISGNPSVSEDIAASGDVDISGNPDIGGEVLSGAPSIGIPPVDAEFYRPNADYELRSDGGVFDVLNQTLTYPDEFNGWKWGGDKWSLSGDTGLDGTYYIEGDAKVSGSPGSPANPWEVTIIATGSIEMSGKPKIQPETVDLLFVAGRDIKITGNPNQSFTGAILAHEQIMISGNPSLEGAAVAEDAENISGTVTENKISGNITITYNGDLAPSLPKVYTGDLNLLSWY